MRLAFFLIPLFVLISLPAEAQFKGEIEVSTIEQIKDMKDDSQVVAEGYIIKRLGDEEYQFRDETGEIQVEIDDDIWRGREIDSKTRIRIYGEFEKDWNNTEIEVERFDIL